MELGDCSLKAFLENSPQLMTAAQCITILMHIARGMHYLHKKNVIHR
jgi:serine/threonine protein kinase